DLDVRVLRVGGLEELEGAGVVTVLDVLVALGEERTPFALGGVVGAGRRAQKRRSKQRREEGARCHRVVSSGPATLGFAVFDVGTDGVRGPRVGACSCPALVEAVGATATPETAVIGGGGGTALSAGATGGGALSVGVAGVTA